MTLCEYGEDYGDDTFRWKAAAVIENEIPQIANERIREKTAANIEKILGGKERDFYV